ncbi:hypothetical protein SLS58_005419 [Diplodia intermedia]|uniref:DH domain-containing protein n=1 Tax=Diplodia intermedia TaxID=856260 RepID=A0ABR3TR74_9PEZI
MVDPITVTYSVVNITTCVLTTAKSLSDLRDKYLNADRTITALCAESSSISASLSQIQGLLLRDGTAHALDAHFAHRPELRDTFDTALTGCTIVYACLEDEIQRLAAGARDADAMTWKVRCRFIWREDTMRDLLSQLRGQQLALNLLVQMLQLESLQELKQLVRDNNQMISRVAQRSRSLRDTHPRVSSRVAESVFSSQRESVMSRVPSMAASTIDQTEFDFDDAVVNSRAYRRALAAAQQRPAKSRTVSEPVESVADPDPDVETLKIGDKKPEIDEDGRDSEEDMKEKDIEKSFTPAETKPTEPAVPAESPELSERKGSVGTISTGTPVSTERKASEDGSSLGSPRTPIVQKFQPGTVSPAPWESPRTNLPRVQRKPLPSGRHVLMPSASMSTLATIPTASQENIAPISRVSSATTATPSIFSANSNPATSSSISLPDTIDSASEPEDDDDNDADTLVEGLHSPTSPSTDTHSNHAALQSLRQHLSTSETVFLNKLTILRTFIEEPIARRWPLAWQSSFIALHHTEKIRLASTTCILDPLKQAAASMQPVSPSFLAKLLRRWLKAAGPAYLAYFRQHPHTASAIRAHCEGTATGNNNNNGGEDYAAFARFVETFAKTHSLDDLLAQPVRRLDAYVQTATRLVQSSSPSLSPSPYSPSSDLADNTKTAAAAPIDPLLTDTLARLEHLQKECHAALATERHAADLQELHRRVGAMPASAGGGGGGGGVAEMLGCLDDGRRLVRLGPVACRPLPVRDIECSISGSLKKPAKAGVMDELPRGTELYPFFVQAEGAVHLLAASTEGERREWMDAVQSVRGGG